MLVWQTLLEMLKRTGRCAMVTLVEVKGSSPREAGARLLVTGEGTYRGTIGGGTLEWRAIAQAQAAIAAGPSSNITSAVLGPDLGQCCGGQVKILTEVFGSSDLSSIADLALRESAGPFSTECDLGRPQQWRRIVERNGEPGTARMANGKILHETFGESRRSIFLFGAGHVGRALILALAPLPLSVTWIDSRPEVFPSAIPANVTPRFAPHPARELDSMPDGSFAVVMTHSHALDLDIVMHALRREGLSYVGLIGSETKRARFLSRLRASGLGEAALQKLVCPIGVPGIDSKLPASIAASVAAELLILDERRKTLAPPVPASRKIA